MAGESVIKIWLVPTLMVISCAPAAMQPATPIEASDLPLVEGIGFVGVIFPEGMAEGATRSLGVRASGFWTPSRDDVKRLESQLRSALEHGQATPQVLDRFSENSPQRSAWVSRTLAKILEQLGRYRRQYIGIVGPDGTRRVLVNSFPGPGDDPPEFYAGWRHQVIAAEDGWFRYWRIQYVVVSGEYREFDSNGGA